MPSASMRPTGPGRRPTRGQRRAALVRRVFRASTAISRGLVTRDELRSRAWQRLFHGVYADSRLTIGHPLRCVAAVAYLLPGRAVIAGRSAATLHGPGLATGMDPVEVVIPPEVRFGPVAGFMIHTTVLDVTDIQLIHGVPVTAPARTCWDLACWLAPGEAVVLIDRMLRSRQVTREQLDAYALARRGDWGSRRVTRAFALVDGRSESPQESRLRAGLALSGLRAPAVQHVISDQAGFLARVDLAWPAERVAVEYDGLWHAGSPAQIHRDRQRLNRLVAAGWLVVHVTSERLRDDLPGLVTEIRAALRARR